MNCCKLIIFFPIFNFDNYKVDGTQICYVEISSLMLLRMQEADHHLLQVAYPRMAANTRNFTPLARLQSRMHGPNNRDTPRAW